MATFVKLSLLLINTESYRRYRRVWFEVVRNCYLHASCFRCSVLAKYLVTRRFDSSYRTLLIARPSQLFLNYFYFYFMTGLF